MTLGSGCASGIDVIQWGCDQIGSGRVLAVLAGAATPRSRDPSTRRGPPSDCCRAGPGHRPRRSVRSTRSATGPCSAKAAGVIVLEDLEHARSRGARVYAEVLGYGSGSEGLHCPGDATRASLEMAVRRAPSGRRLAPREAIDHISTRTGPGSRPTIAPRARVPHRLRSHADNLTVTSLKPVTGSTFAAAGALQVIATCSAMQDQYVTPTINLEIPTDGCDLDYVAGPRRRARRWSAGDQRPGIGRATHRHPRRDGAAALRRVDAHDTRPSDCSRSRRSKSARPPSSGREAPDARSIAG